MSAILIRVFHPESGWQSEGGDIPDLDAAHAYLASYVPPPPPPADGEEPVPYDPPDHGLHAHLIDTDTRQVVGTVHDELAPNDAECAAVHVVSEAHPQHDAIIAQRQADEAAAVAQRQADADAAAAQFAAQQAEQLAAEQAAAGEPADA